MTIATDLAAALDPAMFARSAGIELDPWQAALVRSSAKQVAICASRQSGKSTTVAVLAAHEALYRSSLVLVLAPALRQAQESFRKIRDVLVAVNAPVAEESALRIELVGGSRVICLPGKDDGTIRGYSGVNLLVIDEAARVSDMLYQATRPMLAVSGGRLVALSTPWGKRGWYHSEWTEGGSDWHRVRVTADQCPRIDPEWLKKERLSIPDVVYRAEYGCEFCDNELSVFPYDLIHAALSADVTPLFAGA